MIPVGVRAGIPCCRTAPVQPASVPTPPTTLPRPEDTGVYAIDTCEHRPSADLERELQRLGEQMLRAGDELGLDV